MARLLMTHSYFMRFDPKQWRSQQPYAPLATIQAAACLRKADHDVSLFDTMFAMGPEALQQRLDDFEPDALVIYDDGFNYLTKMCLTNMRDAAHEMIRMAKAKGLKVFVSSSDATDHSEKYLNAGADLVMVGEGEQTLLEVAEQVQRKQENWPSIAGLRYLAGGEMIQTSPRANMTDLDQLPIPAWDLVNVEAYKSRWISSNGRFSINMATTRGCPFKCNWCAKPIYGNRYNSRSPEHVVKELSMLKRDYDFDHVWFCDDIFGLKPGWVNRFADLVNQEGLNFKFHIQSRADLLLKEDNVAALARAGAEEVWIGAESGSQKILDAMDKGTAVEQIVESTRLMKAHGIKPCYFLQFGYTGETAQDIQQTLRLVFDNMPHDIGISVSYPLPGTKFYESVRNQLGNQQNWTDSDDLAMMFKGTFPAEFYRKLQRYVHREFRRRQAMARLRKGSWVENARAAAELTYRIPQSVISRMQIASHV